MFVDSIKTVATSKAYNANLRNNQSVNFKAKPAQNIGKTFLQDTVKNSSKKGITLGAVILAITTSLTGFVTEFKKNQARKKYYGKITKVEKNADGNKMTTFTKKVASGTMETTIISMDRTTKVIHKDKSGKIVNEEEIKYDPVDRVTKSIYKDKSGKITNEVENDYDSMARIRRAIFKEANGASLEYQYDSDGRKIKEIKKDAYGNVV